MRKTNPYSPPRTLRQALWCLVHDSKLKADVLIAELWRVFKLKVAYSYLCNAANPDLAEPVYFQLRLLEPLTRLTGNFVVMDYLEERLGRVAIQIQVLELHRADGSLNHALAETALVEVAKEMGDVAMAIQDGLCHDRRFSPDEALRCRKELWELVQRAATLHHWMGPLTQDPEAVQVELLAV